MTRTRFRQSSPLTKFVSIAIPVALGAAALAFANTRSGKQVRKQLTTQWNNSELAGQARHMFSDAVDTLQDPRTRQAAFDALDVTGLPERTRQAIQDGVRTFRDPQTRQRAMEMAEETRRQAMNLPDDVTRRFQKPKPKRFIFA